MIDKFEAQRRIDQIDTRIGYLKAEIQSQINLREYYESIIEQATLEENLQYEKRPLSKARLLNKTFSIVVRNGDEVVSTECAKGLMNAIIKHRDTISINRDKPVELFLLKKGTILDDSNIERLLLSYDPTCEESYICESVAPNSDRTNDISYIWGVQNLEQLTSLGIPVKAYRMSCPQEVFYYTEEEAREEGEEWADSWEELVFTVGNPQWVF